MGIFIVLGLDILARKGIVRIDIRLVPFQPLYDGNYFNCGPQRVWSR
jgi:hypothetical protein